MMPADRPAPRFDGACPPARRKSPSGKCARPPCAASIDKSDTARSPVPPHHVAAPCRFEAIQRQIKIGRKNVKRAVKLSSLIGHISHNAAVSAGKSVNVNNRGRVVFK